jgi:hypothetical protein
MVGWVEAWRKDRKRAEGGRINMTTAMLSHRGMEGMHFCSLKRFRKVETRTEKRLSFWVFLLSRVVLPWLPATGELRQREILSSLLQKAAAKPSKTVASLPSAREKE